MYSTRAFAALTGVTVKALRHYERVGLLRPARTPNGYRRYTVADLVQVQRILALKWLGLSLTAIKSWLEGGPIRLDAHRATLEDRRARLDRVIAVLQQIQHDADPREALHGFMADAVWDRWETRRQRVAVPRPPDRAPASAIALFHDIADALDEGNQQRQAPALVARSRTAIAPETREAWRRRATWPSGLRRYVASCYEMDLEIWERVVGFIDREYEAPR